MSEVFVQMGVFTDKKEPAAVIMFRIDNLGLNDQSQIMEKFRLYGNLLISQYMVNNSEQSYNGDKLDGEKAASAILDLYHTVANKPILLDNVLVKRGEVFNQITITVRKENNV
jgi:hypothetical protein